jgi:hypothetical protein
VRVLSRSMRVSFGTSTDSACVFTLSSVLLGVADVNRRRAGVLMNLADCWDFFDSCGAVSAAVLAENGIGNRTRRRALARNGVLGWTRYTTDAGYPGGR